jgi:hypothetical protein
MPHPKEDSAPHKHGGAQGSTSWGNEITHAKKGLLFVNKNSKKLLLTWAVPVSLARAP